MLGGSPRQPRGGGLRGAKAGVGEISQDFWGSSLWLCKSDRPGWGGPGTPQLREKRKALEACLKWLPDSESNCTLVCWLLSLPHPPPLRPKRPVTPCSQIPALPRGLRTGQLSAFLIRKGRAGLSPSGSSPPECQGTRAQTLSFLSHPAGCPQRTEQPLRGCTGLAGVPGHVSYGQRLSHAPRSLSSWDKPVFVLRAFLRQQPRSRQLQNPLPTPDRTLQRHRRWKPKLSMRTEPSSVEGCPLHKVPQPPSAGAAGARPRAVLSL